LRPEATVRHVLSDNRDPTSSAVDTHYALREHAERWGMAVVDQAKWDEALRCARIMDEQGMKDPVVIEGEILEEDEIDASDSR
jgi:hypothetical protein